MAGFALTFSIISALVLISNFFQLPELTYKLFYPALGLIFTIRAYFWVLSAKEKMDITEYQNEITKLRQELDRTKKRVADDQTKIEFPEGYKKQDDTTLNTREMKFPPGYKKGEEIEDDREDK